MLEHRKYHILILLHTLNEDKSGKASEMHTIIQANTWLLLLLVIQTYPYHP